MVLGNIQSFYLSVIFRRSRLAVLFVFFLNKHNTLLSYILLCRKQNNNPSHVIVGWCSGTTVIYIPILFTVTAVFVAPLHLLNESKIATRAYNSLLCFKNNIKLTFPWYRWASKSFFSYLCSQTLGSSNTWPNSNCCGPLCKEYTSL